MHTKPGREATPKAKYKETSPPLLPLTSGGQRDFFLKSSGCTMRIQVFWARLTSSARGHTDKSGHVCIRMIPSVR